MGQLLIAVCLVTYSDGDRPLSKMETRVIAAEMIESFERLETVALSYEETGTRESNYLVRVGQSDQITSQVWPVERVRVIRRHDAISFRSTQQNSDAARNPESFLLERILFDGRLLHIQTEGDQDGRQVNDDNFILNLSELEPRGTATENAVARAAAVSRFVESLTPVLGVFGNFPMSIYWGKDATVSGRELSTGQYELHSDSGYGDLTVVVDPEYGSLPRSYKLVKRPFHRVHGGKRLSDLRMETDERFFPAGGFVERVDEANDIYLEQVDGVPYIEALVVERTLRCEEDDVVVKTTQDFFVTRIDVATDISDDAFRPSITIPERQSLQINDGDGEYLRKTRWQSEVHWPVSEIEE